MMTEIKQPDLENQMKEANKFDFRKVFAIGIVLGLVFGTALGNISMGLTTGLVLAAMVNAIYQKKQGKKNANAASPSLLLY